MFENLKDYVLKTVKAIYKSYFSLLRPWNIFYAVGCQRFKLACLI